jgi:hypothetical protein
MSYDSFKRRCIRRGDCPDQVDGQCPEIQCLHYDDMEYDSRERPEDCDYDSDALRKEKP